MSLLSRSTATRGLHLDGVRALVVDESEAMGALVSRLLGDVGASVALAGSVAAAVRKLAEAPFDVVVADCALPDGGGIDVLRSIRKGHAGGPAFVLMTNRPDFDALVAGDGATQRCVWLAKPFSAGELRAAVRSLAVQAAQASGFQS